jgi:hypothetical protein
MKTLLIQFSKFKSSSAIAVSSSTKPTVLPPSLVAVHGLQGDWEKTWEQDGKIWLRDFLGKRIDRVQVMSFGYNSMMNSSEWTHNLDDFSRQLLQAVKNHVDTEQVF